MAVLEKARAVWRVAWRSSIFAAQSTPNYLLPARSTRLFFASSRSRFVKDAFSRLSLCNRVSRSARERVTESSASYFGGPPESPAMPEAVVRSRRNRRKRRKTGSSLKKKNVRVFKGFGCGAIVTAYVRSGGPLTPQFPLGAHKGECGGPRLESQRRR